VAFDGVVKTDATPDATPMPTTTDATPPHWPHPDAKGFFIYSKSTRIRISFKGIVRFRILFKWSIKALFIIRKSKSIGCGFVQFALVDDCLRAIEIYKGRRFGGVKRRTKKRTRHH
jgi:hypothetical protein